MHDLIDVPAAPRGHQVHAADARWAAAGLLARPGLPPHATQRYAGEVFWIASAAGTYRNLTLGRGVSTDDFEAWIRNFYEKMLL